MTRARGEWHDEARALHAADPDMSHAEIGRRVGVATSAVWKLFHREAARAWNRRENAEPHRRAAKTAWDRNHQHKPCPECGGRMARTSDRCEACVSAVADVRRSLVEGMWAAGWTHGEIRGALGVSGDVIGPYRARGWDLPHRRTPEQIERIHAARWAA